MSHALDRQKLEEQIHELDRREHAELGERGTLERGIQGPGTDRRTELPGERRLLRRTKSRVG